MVLRQQMHGMRPIPSYYSSGTCSKQINFHSVAKFMGMVNYKNSQGTSKSKEEAQVVSALKHKEAERKRRVRINGQYANLRNILPSLIKRNKASVLAETIQHVKELKNTVSQLKEMHGVGRLDCVFPGGTEMLRVEYNKERGQRQVKVMFSCEDKKKLMPDISRAVRSVKGKVMRAELVTMCGWTECVLWVQGISGNLQLEILRTALDAIIDPRLPNSKSQLTS